MKNKITRPWGNYTVLAKNKDFLIKKIVVNPQGVLSYQSHDPRSEHWVIIDGEASVTNGEETLTLIKGESTYIPIGVVHSLENKTSQILEIIEVQSGIYLGEDDIVRLEDIYGRVN